jgi:type II secretory pathway pseudopilin PulG
MNWRHQRQAITLVELLIVIAIIGVLIQLTVPAVQSAREAARRTACQNNLHQIGLAMQQHESALRYLPTAGWGWAWIGDPDRGAGRTQPGSWAYQLLPFMQQTNVYEIGRGLNGQAKHEALAHLASTPVSIFYCPSRSSPSATPNVGPRVTMPDFDEGELFWYNAMEPTTLARTDYVANIGDKFVYWGSGPIPPRAEANEGFFEFSDREGEVAKLQDVTGVVVQRHSFTMAHIRDGTTKTYFVGEKFIPPSAYLTGTNLNDDQSCWNGDDLDLLATTELAPLRDRPTIGTERGRYGLRFGSAHVDGLNMVLCGGSVQFVSYDIDPEIHRQLGNRRDSLPVTEAF